MRIWVDKERRRSTYALGVEAESCCIGRTAGEPGHNWMAHVSVYLSQWEFSLRASWKSGSGERPFVRLRKEVAGE